MAILRQTGLTTRSGWPSGTDIPPTLATSHCVSVRPAPVATVSQGIDNSALRSMISPYLRRPHRSFEQALADVREARQPVTCPPARSRSWRTRLDALRDDRILTGTAVAIAAALIGFAVVRSTTGDTITAKDIEELQRISPAAGSQAVGNATQRDRADGPIRPPAH